MSSIMFVKAVDSLNALEAKKNISEIVGLSKVNGNIYDSRANRDTELSKFHEKIYEDQLLVSTRLLQYYNQLNCKDTVACSLQESALRTLYRIYSSRLRPSAAPEVPIIEKVLLKELLVIISRTYGIQGESGCPSNTSEVESCDSPLWELNDHSLKLIRVFIDSNLLSAVMAQEAEDCLTKLIITTHQYQLAGQTWPFTSTNFALLAHCLCKLLQANNSSPESGQRRLLSPSFIRDHLFPLACEFAAREYPATIVDPIGHYLLFEESGKLSEPDEALAEWNQRNEGKKSAKDLSGAVDNCSDLGSDPLPSAHACLEHLIFRLILASTGDNQGIIINFLQGEIHQLRDKDSDHDSGINIWANVNEEASKLALMNKVVALHVLGRVMLHLKSEAISTFLKTKALPFLPQVCLLVKICKFQLVRYCCTDDTAYRSKLAYVFLGEFRAIERIEDFQDERNKLFVIFTCVASNILFEGDVTYFKHLTDTYLRSREREAQLSLVKKLITLYLDYKIITPLMLVGELVRIHNDDDSFKSACEPQLTKAIDQIANHFLTLFSTDRRYTNSLLALLASLYTATQVGETQLPDEAVEKLLKITEIRLLDDDPSLHQNYELTAWNIQNNSYLTCALKYPLGKLSQAHAMRIFDRLLDSFRASNKTDIAKMTFATMILASLCFYQVTSSSSSDSRDSNKCSSHNLLFDSPNRIGSICEACESIKDMSDMTSCWVMSILMSWPSSSVAVETKTPGASGGLDIVWQRLVKLALIGLGEFELTKESHGFNSRPTLLESLQDFNRDCLEKYRTRDNFLHALMAAFNHQPKLLMSHISHAKGPASSGDSHILRYVKFWLNSITRSDNLPFQDIIDATRASRSHTLISHQALMNMHRAHTKGELVFSIDELKSQLNSARQIVLNRLVDLSKKAIHHGPQLTRHFKYSIQQLRATGEFR